MEDEAWRYTFDEDGNMVERRCRTTLLAQTEGDASPLPARNEVNPRAELAQASWSFPGEDRVQSVETIFEPASFQYSQFFYSTFGIEFGPSSSPNKTLYHFASQSWEEFSILYNRFRFYFAGIGRYNSSDPIREWHEYFYVGNNPISFSDPYGLFKIDSLCCNPFDDWKPKIEEAVNNACTNGTANLEAQGLRALAHCIREQCLSKKVKIDYITTRAHPECSPGIGHEIEGYVNRKEKNEGWPIHICIDNFKVLEKCRRTNVIIYEAFHRCELKIGGKGSDKRCTSYKIGNIPTNHQCDINCPYKG